MVLVFVTLLGLSVSFISSVKTGAVIRLEATYVFLWMRCLMARLRVKSGGARPRPSPGDNAAA